MLTGKPTDNEKNLQGDKAYLSGLAAREGAYSTLINIE
jgi:hypothetical protein